MRRIVYAVSSTAALLAGTWVVAQSAAAGEYYRGKTIDIVVGSDVGGGYDIYARTIARHIGRHIPGQPLIVVKNMPGAGGGRAAAYVSTVAAKDGTAIAATQPGAIMAPLLEDRAEPLFDPTRALYIGSASNGTRICAAMAASNVKNFDDAAARKTIIGATTTSDSTRDYAFMHKRTSGVQFDVVAGYKNTADIGLAMERGEVQGVCGWDWSSFKSQKSDWLRDKKVNLLVQVGMEPDAELTQMGVPSVWNYVRGDDKRKAVEFIASQQAIVRPYLAAAETPAEAIAVLRAAFDATMADPQFLADAEKSRIAIAPLNSDKVQELVKKIFATPRETVALAKQVIQP
jgi:tripartite-type tricarboxylate transporter receptor subunit TctC